MPADVPQARLLSMWTWKKRQYCSHGCHNEKQKVLKKGKLFGVRKYASEPATLPPLYWPANAGRFEDVSPEVLAAEFPYSAGPRVVVPRRPLTSAA